MARKRSRRQGLRTHRSYSVGEAATALGLCTATLRRWIKVGKIKPIDDQRPALLAASDLIALTTKANKPKQRCKANEAYCLRCRDVRPMAFDEAEIIAANATGANLRALCGTCSALMHKRVSLRALPDLAQKLTLCAPLALQHLISTEHASLNVHFAGAEPTQPNLAGEGVAKRLTQTITEPVGSTVSIANTVRAEPTYDKPQGA